MSALIHLEGISKTIPRSTAMSLRDATCTIRRGEFVSIIGTSGSGKTTLLSILGLLERPSSGTYLFGRIDVASLDERARDYFRGHRIGFVFQNSYLVAEETAARNVGLGLRVRGIQTRRQPALIEKALAQVGLSDVASRQAGDLSGGEKQRVAVARALVMRPDVILADEPTGALDSDSTNRLVELLRQINAAETTVIVVTHDPLVANAADRIIRIEDGVVFGNADNPDQWSEPTKFDSQPKVSTTPYWSAFWNPEEEVVRLGETDNAYHDSPLPVGMTVYSGDASDPTPASRRPPATVAAIANGGIARAYLIRQEASDALLAPLSRPVRAGLVLMAYLLGVAALVGATGVMSGATGQIVHRLTEAGSNLIQVIDNSPPDNTWDTLNSQAHTIESLEGARATVPVRTYAVASNTITRLRGSGRKFVGTITITDQRYFQAWQMMTASGSADLLVNRWGGPVVVLGSMAARTLDVASADPGVSLWANDRPIDVAAVLAPTGDAIFDNVLYFSPGAIPLLTDQLDSRVEVHTQPGYAEPLAKAIPTALNPANPGQIHISTVAQLAQLQQGINSDLGSLLAIIGWVTLLLSALTAGTTMFLSVQHRAAEIALRRAMGASRGSIFRLFAIEGTTIGLAGGILGTALGIVLTAVVINLNHWPLAIGLGVIPQGLTVGLVAGTIASIIPAAYAAHRDPSQILRTV